MTSAFERPPTGKALRRALPIVLILGLASVAFAAVIGTGNDRVRGTIAEGTMIVGALARTVSTENAEPGDRIELRTVAPIEVTGKDAIPAGAVLRGEVTHARGGGRIAGAPELTLRFTELEIDGDEYAVSTEPFRVRGKNDAVESAAEIGGGAAVGGIVGGILGGGDDAVKGAVLGAAVGTGVAVATKGDEIVLPVGQRLRVRLTTSVTVRYTPSTITGE